MAYNLKKIEKKWQKIWEESGLYKNRKKPKKFYILDMFPYPSGEGLHVGHPRGYIATDIVARFKMMQGYEVLHPMGWDAFGLPAENYALKKKIHPRIAVAKNIKRFKEQLKMFGFSYDWSREINTTDSKYYKWTQWIFLQMFKKGLAYESFEPINWCPSCKTGLANEDLENGKCERCESEVEKKPLRQWILKMTAYADRLLEDLKLLDWPEPIIEQQRNWIGRSEGAIIKFGIKYPRQLSLNQHKSSFIEVFTTRLDTVFGCTYLVIAPERVSALTQNSEFKIKNLKEIENYIFKANKKSDLQRTDLAKEKTGVELKGVKAINPFNNKEIPIFVGDYVLSHYGTGAVMAVPAHDERDFEFAKKYGLPIKIAVCPNYPALVCPVLENAFTEDGYLVNSGQFTGLTSSAARDKMAEWLIKNKLGGRKVNYKMRDWVFSRQRYWGEPIPIIRCVKCGNVPVPEKDLPVKLPEVKFYKPSDIGESPLANIKKWMNVKCPKCGGAAKRETNTMPQWAGSSWYYLRYIDPQNKKALVDKKKEKQWMPVNLYVGGVEHATRHLLYARFWHKFLYDIKSVSTKEPFKKLINQGLILAEDGKKMSKRWGNVVNPDDMISQFGADALRLYEMFLGPFTQSIAWNIDGIRGTKRFIDRIYKTISKIKNTMLSGKLEKPKLQVENQNLERLLHQTIKKVTEDIENFHFNTAISSLMILFNEFEKNNQQLTINNLQIFIKLLAPFAPHIAEELWQQIRGTAKIGRGQTRKFKSIYLEAWPKYNPKLIIEEQFELIIQINGKIRDKIFVKFGIIQKEAEELALNQDKIKSVIAGQKIKKIIFVPNKLINIVI